MSARRVIASSILLWWAMSGLAAAQPAARFGLTIGVNESSSTALPTLRYADDDAIAMHQLLHEAGVDDILLVQPDPETRELHPKLVARAPTASELARAIEEVANKVRIARARGQRSELWIHYSGHGDVEAGEGFVMLAEHHLTRQALFDLLTRIGAARNHVIVDACASYYLAYDRGPGGRRRPYTGGPLLSAVPSQLSNTGFLLSTSSEQASQEWALYRAGVFSHGVRSALRGAADIDADGAVSYAEIGAFLRDANAQIGARLRPEFHVRPPEGNLRTELLRWSEPPGLTLEPSSWGHLFLETEQGERLLDLHPSARLPVRLWVPGPRPLFLVRHDQSAEYVIEGDRADGRDPQPPELKPRDARRRALGLLYATPFEPSDVERFVHDVEATPTVAPRETPMPRRATWMVAGSAVALATTGLALRLAAGRAYRAIEERLETCDACTTSQVRSEQQRGRSLTRAARITSSLSGVAVLGSLVLFRYEPRWRGTRVRADVGWNALRIEAAF